MIDYTKIFEYNDGAGVIPKDSFRISPSGVEKFFSDKTTWYRENLLGEAKKFTGSTSTVLGTCVHAVAEIVVDSLTEGVPHDRDLMNTSIDAYIAKYDGNEEYDTQKIRDLWHNMAEPLVKDFVLQANTIATEGFIHYELLPGIEVGGSYDAITSTVPNDDLLNPKGILTVRDYKTASKKPTSFSYAYKLQAYTYAYILRQQGIPISQVELCYTIQPTKAKPSEYRTLNFTLPFDDQAYAFIEGILLLIADSVQAFKALPEWRYLLMADYRMKLA